MTLIQPDDTSLLWAVILAGVALSIWLEQTFSWAAKLSGPVLALCLAMALANTMARHSASTGPLSLAAQEKVCSSQMLRATPARITAHSSDVSSGWINVMRWSASVGATRQIHVGHQHAQYLS